MDENGWMDMMMDDRQMTDIRTYVDTKWLFIFKEHILVFSQPGY